MERPDSPTASEANLTSPIPVTVVVLTFNEEDQIKALAENLKYHFDDIHIVDSGSTDGTILASKEAGLPVYIHPFTGFGDQRNWAIDHVPHKYSWVLHLDADERLTDEFIGELKSTVSTSPSEAGFYVPNKLLLGDQWLRHSSGYPVYQVRLFHRDRLRFENHGHGQREVTQGTVGFFRQPYLHYGFSKGVEAWMEKHAKYAAREVDTMLMERREHEGGLRLVRRCMSFDPVYRRRALKSLSLSIPARPFLRFFYTLVVKRGILDGKAGIVYAKMLAAYEAMFVAMLAAKRQSRN